MKSVFFTFMTLFLCSEAAASDLSSIERKQRLLVSRFYEVMEIIPENCPLEAKKEFIISVERFERSFPDFNFLLKNSKFRAYAVDNFSNSSQLDEDECLYYKEALDMHMDTEKGKNSMEQNLVIMNADAK